MKSKVWIERFVRAMNVAGIRNGRARDLLMSALFVAYERGKRDGRREVRT